MKVTKEITFDVAHMLSYYEGKCANLHGHTYKLQVTLEGNVGDVSHMVLDFNILKEVLNESVMDVFDHAIVFSDPKLRNEAEDELYAWAETYGKKYAVIPNGKVIGLSKVARIAEMCGKRLQLQERIGSDIADVLEKVLGTDDIIVVIEGEHSCMTTRGIKSRGSKTKTATLRGIFKNEIAVRNEFYSLINK